MSSAASSPASAASGAVPPPHVVEDCLGAIQLLSDGTVKRAPAPPGVLPDAPWPPSAAPVRCKDVVYDEAHDLRLRMYVPSAGARMLPVLVYFHGGGFCVGSFASPQFHAACLRLAAGRRALRRLPPRPRAPPPRHARRRRRPLLLAARPGRRGHRPVARRVGGLWPRVRVRRLGRRQHRAPHGRPCGSLAADPARVAGCVLLWPYFGGEERTASEAACPADVFLTLALYDQMWRLALPAGATRDHPAANPFGPASPALGPVELPPLLVAAGGSDMLVDRIRDYVARLKAAGKSRVELVEFAGQGHGFSVFEPDGEAATELIRVVRRFVHGGAPAAPPS